MSPCVRGEAGTSSVVVPRWRPVVVARRLLVACRVLFACRLPVACRLLFACRFLFACRLPMACRLACRLSSRVACLRVSLSSGAVNGWWCWVFAASRGAGPLWPFVAGGVVTSLRRGRVVRRRCRRPWGGRSPFPSAHASAGLVCYPTVVLGLQTRSVRWGGHDHGVATHIPQRPRHVRGVGAPLVRYRACTVVLGLQTRLVRWGAMTTGGRSPSPAPRHVRGMGTPPVR